MKTTLIRMMAFIVLATSISAFAENGGTKPGDAAATCTTQQNDSKQEQKTNQDENKTIRQQDTAWDHSLQGIYGG